MKAVAVKELENRLSAYSRDAKNGDVVLATDRGQVIAELRQPTAGSRLPDAPKTPSRVSPFARAARLASRPKSGSADSIRALISRING
jgi:antitoxin (DNA-binding transcriptional repressor) of toxin-antitoxin stability system